MSDRGAEFALSRDTDGSLVGYIVKSPVWVSTSEFEFSTPRFLPEGASVLAGVNKDGDSRAGGGARQAARRVASRAARREVVRHGRKPWAAWLVNQEHVTHQRGSVFADRGRSAVPEEMPGPAEWAHGGVLREHHVVLSVVYCVFNLGVLFR